MFHILEWSLPLSFGALTAAQARLHLRRSIQYIGHYHGLASIKELRECPRYQYQILINDHELTVFALAWPTYEIWHPKNYMRYRILP